MYLIHFNVGVKRQVRVLKAEKFHFLSVLSLLSAVLAMESYL